MLFELPPWSVTAPVDTRNNAVPSPSSANAAFSSGVLPPYWTEFRSAPRLYRYWTTSVCPICVVRHTVLSLDLTAVISGLYSTVPD